MSILLERRRVLPVVIALLVLLATLVPIALWYFASRSSASFADAEILDANRLGAATLDIEVGPAEGVLEAQNLAPGDAVTGQLDLENVGELPLRFGLRARTGGGVLASWLTFSVWPTTGVCSPDDPQDLLARDLALSSTDTTLVALDPEAPRLAPGDAATLCLHARLPLEATNEVQGQRLVIDLVVDAEHDIATTDPREDQ